LSRAKIRFNSEWLSRLTFGDVLRLCQQFSLNDYLAREIMKKKLEAGVSIRLDEVLYPLMQGYDSYTMDTDVQVGAADQTFNMQAGRVLQKKLRGKESFVLVNDYLIGTDGRKMSKSWDNAIWLSDTAENMFGKTMSLKDELIEPYFVLGTKTSLGQIQEMKNRLAKGENPMVLKKELAKIIVTEFHGQAKADQAQHQFEKQFQEKTFSEASLNEVIYEPNTDFASFLIAGGCASSKAEVKSLIKDGAVQKQQANGFVRLKTEPLAIKDGDVFKVGRKLIKVKARA
jgi:tyrosyl-tRNA synthetase